MDAVRWGLFAERGTAMLKSVREVLAQPTAGATPETIKAKLAVVDMEPALNSVLFPKDGDDVDA